ncbi:hypothetical protein D3C79_669500 [compost metagenome]
MLTQVGCRSIALGRCLRTVDGEPHRAQRTVTRMLDAGQHSVLNQLRMGQKVTVVSDFCTQDIGFAQHFEPVGRRASNEDRIE